MALSNTATPIYYGRFREAVMRGEIPVCREISMEMNRIDDLIANPGIYYDDISLANTLSVIADPYVQEHFCNLRYVTLYGGKWKVTDASVEYPRIVLTLGGLWHGNETE